MWWPALKYNLALHWHIVKYFFISGQFRVQLGLISLTTLLPAFLPAFRWPASFGDRSQIGNALTTVMFHLVHGVLLLICIWGAFDPPFSARHLGSGLPFLTFYYLAALGIGYYSGYFLVVSRTPPPRKNSRRQPSALLQFRSPATVVALAVLTILAAACLVYKNHPAIQSINGGVLKQYSRLMEDSLPQSGGLLLSDSDTVGDSPRRLFLLQAALAQDGREKEFVPVDTFALLDPDYHRYLHRKHPAQWPLVVDSKSKNLLDPHGLLALMEMLSKTNAIYYLHPSFGYYFEVFYPEPHGLVYQLKNLPGDTLLPPLPDGRVKAENDAFWTRAESAAFAPILQEVSPDNRSARSGNLFDQIMLRLHVAPEPNPNALLAGSYYSCCLDYWGVQEQRANDLKSAAAHFETAFKLNPENQVAAVNLEFNHNLQAGQPASVDLARTTTEQFSKFHSPGEIFMVDGPFDEPAFCYEDGMAYLQNSYLHQAITSFTRVRQLVPDYLPALLSLGELFDFVHQPERALAVLKEPLAHPARFSLNDNNSTELNITAAAAFIQNTNLTRGVGLIEKEIAHHPDDNNLLTTAVQVYLTQGLYTNALRVIQLRLDHAPNDPVWLYGQAITYMRMPDYDRAIASLTRVLTLQTNNYDALLNRALACLNTGKLEAARADYLQVQKAYPKDFHVTYGLGEIAWRRHETNAAIQNYTSCLENAPTNMAEFKLVSQRLADLKGKPR
jgi:tetratricopeptide (TPR) repeat protein